MKKFVAIEGLRGWLAWAVVVCHLVQTSDLYARGLGPALVQAGLLSVLIFIIISGFVITHMVSERPEPYGSYLLRRFMRIFPLFAITCVIGYFTNDIHVAALARVPWANTPSTFGVETLYADIARSNHEYFLMHALSHLTMLHGVISNALLPFSQSAFNSPAWSLSLEWQFYLVAPFVITLANRPQTCLWVALAVAVLEITYQLGALGDFRTRSFLPGAAGFFAVGIASRLVYPMISGTLRKPGVILALCLVLLPLCGWDRVPLLIWALVFAGLVLDRSNAAAESFAQTYRLCLESPIATYFGSRSYSVYLGHLPIIGVCHWVWLDIFPLAGRAATFFGVSAMVVPLTILAAEILHRGIERPGMALGSKLARWNAGRMTGPKSLVQGVSG
jgi:peptidoglycan/LPS O-acetylase OafA/YrhL